MDVYVKGAGQPLAGGPRTVWCARSRPRLAGIKGVESFYVRSGGFTSNGGPNSAPNDTVGRIRVDFVDYEERMKLGLQGRDIENTLKSRLGEVPGVQLEVRGPQNGPPVGKEHPGPTPQQRSRGAQSGRQT